MVMSHSTEPDRSAPDLFLNEDLQPGSRIQQAKTPQIQAEPSPSPPVIPPVSVHSFSDSVGLMQTGNTAPLPFPLEGLEFDFFHARIC
jgi:hypothetical protein